MIEKWLSMNFGWYYDKEKEWSGKFCRLVSFVSTRDVFATSSGQDSSIAQVSGETETAHVQLSLASDTAKKNKKTRQVELVDYV